MVGLYVPVNTDCSSAVKAVGVETVILTREAIKSLLSELLLSKMGTRVTSPFSTSEAEARRRKVSSMTSDQVMPVVSSNDQMALRKAARRYTRMLTVSLQLAFKTIRS